MGWIEKTVEETAKKAIRDASVDCCCARLYTLGIQVTAAPVLIYGKVYAYREETEVKEGKRFSEDFSFSRMQLEFSPNKLALTEYIYARVYDIATKVAIQAEEGCFDYWVKRVRKEEGVGN